jgi:integrase
LSIRAGLAFTALTALRTGEILELRWTDFAKDGLSLTIPAERMKGGEAHTLSVQAREVIDGIRSFSEGRDHVFPGRDPRGPLSNMAMLMTLTRMAPGFTVHGFRSSFSTWAHASCVS